MFTSRMAGMHGSNRYRTNIGGFNQGDESCGQFSIKYVQEDNLKWQGYSFFTNIRSTLSSSTQDICLCYMLSE